MNAPPINAPAPVLTNRLVGRPFRGDIRQAKNQGALAPEVIGAFALPGTEMIFNGLGGKFIQ
jgi:hypothetical protein